MKKKLIKSYFLSDLVEKSMTTRSELEFIADKLGINLKVSWLKDVDPTNSKPKLWKMRTILYFMVILCY